ACAPHDVRDAIRHTRAIASMNEATGAARAMRVMARCRRAMERTTSAASARQLESERSAPASPIMRVARTRALASSCVGGVGRLGAAISRCHNRQQSL
ncbi:hypothetical protein, partial [Burkholderia pseudomallei]|uniref:hypothetical protein n=1 Tax=Burkholderia pseudomallei TaxID=28450 RepID=UPI002174FB91